MNRNRKYHNILLVIIVISMLSSFTGCSKIEAGESSLDQRLNVLEKKIVELENKLNKISNSNGVNTFTYKETLEVDKDEKFDMNDIKNISLDMLSEQVIIHDTKEKIIRVVTSSNYDLKDEQKIQITKNNTTLNIKSGLLKNNYNGFNFNNGSYVNNLQQKIEIYLPTEYRDEIEINMTSGSVTADQKLNLNSFDLDMTSGSVKLEDLEAKDYNIDITSGYVEINSLKGSGDILETSGKIVLNYVLITDELDIDITSGNLKCAIAKNSSFKFEGNSTSGDISTYFKCDEKNNDNDKYNWRDDKEKTATVGNGPYKNLTVDITSGNVEIIEADR